MCTENAHKISSVSIFKGTLILREYFILKNQDVFVPCRKRVYQNSRISVHDAHFNLIERFLKICHATNTRAPGFGSGVLITF